MTNIHTPRNSLHGNWSSRLGFIMAASGAAIGLGNIWKFPYIAGKNGGGAFVLLYLACVFLIGMPIIMAELIVGRRGARNPAKSMALLAVEAQRNKSWQWLGSLCILASFLILSYYGVIAGWAVDYIGHAARGLFSNGTPASIDLIFKQMLASPLTLLFWQSVVMIATIWVVARGVEKGLEKAVYVMFPCMVIMLLILVGYAWQTGYFMQGVEFLFHPGFASLTPEATLVAVGHAFFTLSIATGTMMVYGAYLPKSVSITNVAVYITVLDTGIALLAGLAIFPLVFAHHLVPSAGPGLIFKTLPLAFGQMHSGNIIGVVFFVMLVLAAFSSAISLLEPSVAWLMETYNVKRKRAAIVCGVFIWLIGLLTVFSFNWAQNFKILGHTMFEMIDYVTANIFLPLSGLMIALFVAWIMKKEVVREELNMKSKLMFTLWYTVLRFIVPIAIVLVFLFSLGIIK